MDDAAARTIEPVDLLDLRIPGQLTVTADGGCATYVLSGCDAEADRNTSELWEVRMDAPHPRRVSRGPGDADPTWSPTDRVLAFTAETPGRSRQVWLRRPGEQARQLTKLTNGNVDAVEWAPSGGRLAVQAATFGDGGAPIVIDRLDNQRDPVGLNADGRSHIGIVDVRTGGVRRVSPEDRSCWSPRWAPSGHRLAWLSDHGADSDLTLTTTLEVLDATSTEPASVIGLSGMFVAELAWADEDRLLVVGSRRAAADGARLWCLDLRSGQLLALSADLDRTVLHGSPGYPGARPQLDPHAGEVLFCARDAGCTKVYAVRLDGTGLRCVSGGDGGDVSSLALVPGEAARRTAVAVLSGPGSVGDVVEIDLADGATRMLAAHGTIPGVRFPRRRFRRFTTRTGDTVDAWVMGERRARRPQPLLLDIHGGPHNAWNGAADSAHLYQYELVRQGWVVVLPNPRGSDGYGTEMLTAVTGAWGQADREDVLAVVDALVAEGVADRDRLAVTGYSYGGFMTAYLTGRDHRFAAAVAGGMVSDLVSMTGTAKERRALSQGELGGSHWEQPTRYATMSPLTRVADVVTPTLILHGQADEICPLGQAEQWFTALRVQRVPTSLVVYPEAGHGLQEQGRPSHRLDYNARVVGWLRRHVPFSRRTPESLDAARGNRSARNASHASDELLAQRYAGRAGVNVRLAETADDLAAISQLFDHIWRPDEVVLPTEVLRAVVLSGGYVSMARDGDQIVGGSVGFFQAPDEHMLHSHITAVDPERAPRSTGFALKLHQRAWALARGAEAIGWTFDPAIARNGYFNVGKLAARPTAFHQNLYGALNDERNGTDDTDRLFTRWELRSAAVLAACDGQPNLRDAERERGRGTPVVLSADEDDRPVRTTFRWPDQRRIVVGLPTDIEAMRARDPAMALAWCTALREILGEAMADGGCIPAFVPGVGYLVEHDEQ